MEYNLPVPHEYDPKHVHEYIKCAVCKKCRWADVGIGCMYGGPFTGYEIKGIDNDKK